MTGFNKRFITENRLKTEYNQKGYEGLLEYVRKPDTLILTDDFSKKIIKLIEEGDSEQRIKVLMRYGTNDERSKSV